MRFLIIPDCLQSKKGIKIRVLCLMLAPEFGLEQCVCLEEDFSRTENTVIQHMGTFETTCFLKILLLAFKYGDTDFGYHTSAFGFCGS